MAADSSPSMVLIRNNLSDPSLQTVCTRARRRGDENLAGDYPKLAAHSRHERPAPCHPGVQEYARPEVSGDLKAVRRNPVAARASDGFAEAWRPGRTVGVG